MKDRLDTSSRKAWPWAVSRRAWTFQGPLVATVMLLAGCGASIPAFVTPQHVESYGTALFHGSSDTVFRACVLALRRSGHRIEAAERSTGIVVTGPDGRLVAEERPRHGYVVQLRSSPDGRVTVVATPAAADEPACLQGGALPRRDLDRERAAWERLFADIRALMDHWGAEPP